MNLVKELHKTAAKNYSGQLKEAEQVLESVKANLQMESQKDAEMLQYFGTLKSVPQSQQKITSVKGFLAEELVSLKDIRKVCLDYHLRFLSAESYKKEIPLSVLNDLRKFKDENLLSESLLKNTNNLMIIAPASHFVLGDRPKKDPVLLWRKGDHYKVISTWGNDFNALRKFEGFVYRSPVLLTFALILLLINGFITFGFFQWNWSGASYIVNVAVLISFLFLAMDNDFEDASSENYWNQPYKR